MPMIRVLETCAVILAETDNLEDRGARARVDATRRSDGGTRRLRQKYRVLVGEASARLGSRTRDFNITQRRLCSVLTYVHKNSL